MDVLAGIVLWVMSTLIVFGWTYRVGYARGFNKGAESASQRKDMK